MAEFGTISGRMTIEVGGQRVDVGVVHIPVKGRINGSELVLSARLGEVRDVIASVFSRAEPPAEWERELLGGLDE